MIWVHDYHMIPLAAALRAAGPRQPHRFLPPYPVPAAWNHDLVAQSRAAHSVAACEYDVVGFQTDSDPGNFVRYLICECDSRREMRVFETTGRQTTSI